MSLRREGLDNPLGDAKKDCLNGPVLRFVRPGATMGCYMT